MNGLWTCGRVDELLESTLRSSSSHDGKKVRGKEKETGKDIARLQRYDHHRDIGAQY